jgi:flagellar biogenesis protein FliO
MSSAATAIQPRSTGSGNTLLLCLFGLAAVIGGYWLPAHLTSPGEALGSPAPTPNEAGTKPPTDSVASPPPRPETPDKTFSSRPSSVASGGTKFPQGVRGPDEFDLMGPLWRLGWATLVVFGVVLVGIWLLRRSGWRPRVAAPAQLPMQVAGELPLAGRSRLVLVQVGHERVLVALDARGISAVVALSPRFSEFLDGPLHERSETGRRTGAVLAAMVGDGDEGHGS